MQDVICLLILVNITGALDNCDQTLSVTGPGTMTFPDQGLPHYHRDMECTFSLTAPANQNILFSFNYFDVSVYLNAHMCSTMAM